MSKKGIMIEKPTGNALYCHYTQQNQPQPTHIELDPGERTLRADYDPDVGNGVPESVWYGRRYWYTCPILTDSAAAKLLEQIAPLAERVCDGYSEALNDQSNYVGRLSEDALAASDEIERTCYDYGDEDTRLHVWEAGEWLQGVSHDTPEGVRFEAYGTVTAATTDPEIEQMAERIEADATADGVILDHPDAERYLRGLRNSL